MQIKNIRGKNNYAKYINSLFQYIEVNNFYKAMQPLLFSAKPMYAIVCSWHSIV